MTKTIILAAGGTGGHVFPAIALAQELKMRGYAPVLLTDHRIDKFANAIGIIPRHIIYAGKLSPKGLIHLLLGLVQSFLYFLKVKPVAVVGFGGYPSFPGMAMGLVLGIPTVLHEQNSYMGKANRLFAPFVKRVALSFPNTRAIPESAKTKCSMVGNPVRPAIKRLGKSVYSVSDDEIFLLITGGSQGSSIFSEIIPPAINQLPLFLQRKLRITQQCRPAEVAATQDFYNRNQIKAHVAAFINDMHMELARADLVIARAGASTCAELAVAGRPAILVPYPHATEDHQTTNARWLADAGAAIIIPQADLTPTILANMLQNLLQSLENRSMMAQAAHNLGIPDAESALADLVEKYVKPS